VTSLGKRAFSGCSALENITLSENLTRISYGTFQKCKSLSSISIPGSVKEIEQYYYGKTSKSEFTFDGCELLKEVSFLYGKPILISGYYNSSDDFIYCEWEPWTEQLEKVFLDRELVYNLSVPNLKELTIGEHLAKLQIEDINKCSQLESIVSYAMTPPTYFYYFSNAQYMNLVVKVPNEALEAYQKDSVWGNFWNLQGFDTSGVDDVEIDSVDKTVVGRYDLNGRPVNEDYKGITIVRFSDGSIKKVVL
jgi:putative conserved repeat protein